MSGGGERGPGGSGGGAGGMTPEMRERFRQMRESGEMTPEMRERMRQIGAARGGQGGPGPGAGGAEAGGSGRRGSGGAPGSGARPGSGGGPAGGFGGGGTSGGGTRTARTEVQLLWKLTPEKQLKPVQVRTSITDYSYTAVVDVLKGELKDGDTIVTGMSIPTRASTGQFAPGMGGPMGGGRPPGMGGGGPPGGGRGR